MKEQNDVQTAKLSADRRAKYGLLMLGEKIGFPVKRLGFALITSVLVSVVLYITISHCYKCYQY